MSARAALSRSPLRLPTFRIWWSGLLVSRIGDQFTTIALLWFVLQLTGSGVALGTVLLCFSLPGILTSAPLGSLMDQYQPRLVIGLDNAARCVLIGAIPMLHWAGVLQLWMIDALALIAGALSPATLVGGRVLVPHLVSDDDLEAANALLSMTLNLPTLIGPALAGVLVGAISGPSVLVIDAASFLVMALVAFRLPVLPFHHERVGPSRIPGLGGFRALFALPEVWRITALSGVFFLAYWPLEPALPVYSQDIHIGATGFGLLWTGFGIGALVGLAAIPWAGLRSRPGVIFSVIAILWGLFLLPVVVLHTLVPAMVCFALAGCAWSPYMTIETTLLQRLVPARQHGQVFGARASITTATGPLGLLAGGLLLDHVAAATVIGVSGLTCMATGVVGLLTPRLRAIRRPAREVAPEPPASAASTALAPAGEAPQADR